jgi:hypothetical protein
MKKYLKYVILSFAMLVVWHSTFAQKATNIEQIIQTPNSIPYNMVYSNENEITVFQISNSTTSRYSVNRYSTDGQFLGSVIPWSDEELSTMRIHDVELYSELNGNVGLYYVSTRLGTDTATFHKITVTEDMDLVYQDFQWYGLDFPVQTQDRNGVKTFVVKNREVLLSYNDNFLDSVHIVRFDADGEVMAERKMECYGGHATGGLYYEESFYHKLIPTPDSTGCRFITGRHYVWGPYNPPGPLVYTCFTMDEHLNVVDSIKNTDTLSFPFLCGNMAYYRVNPHNGRSYSVNSFSLPAYNGNPEIEKDLLMGVYDENMFQLNYTWAKHSNERFDGGFEHSIDFDSDDNVYMLGDVDYEFLYIACMDEDLNKIGEIYIKEPDIPLGATCLIALPEGGCLVSSSSYYSYDGYIYKVTLSDLLDIEEAHSHGFTMAMAYPNPGKDVLNIRTALEDAHLEVYDLNGRLMHNQRITENVTTIDAAAWPSGVYVWKVIAYGKEAESGKWIKQ